MTVPFKVKAVYEYKSEEADDLSFDNGQIITVVDDEDPDWYTGEYADATGQKIEGIFPRNFVEKYEPAIPTRPVRAPKKAPQPEPIPEPQPEPPASTLPPPGHDVAKEAEVEPPQEFEKPTAAPAVEQPPPPAAAPVSAKKAPPPVSEKPSSFKDRIAAFNKPAAAPVTPFKPSAPGQSFIKKPFVAPPPSRNAYVPPPTREPPPQKVYRREEELEREEHQAEPDLAAAPAQNVTADEEDQPKTETLKERIARLQAQQLETAQRQAEGTKKKEKPKRPSKPRTESSEAVHGAEDGTELERTSTERPRPIEEDHLHTEQPASELPPPPLRELVSDTNDADDSGAGDTEDAQDLSTEEDKPKARSAKPPPVEEPSEDGEDEDTEDEDPEVRRKRELRERMAKMSGGMGMMGMFGAGAGAAATAKKPKAQKDEHHEPEQEDVQRAPPIPIMALPGMSQKQQPKPIQPDSDTEPESAQPTPVPAHQDEDDYVSQQPSRKSTERSQPMSPRDRPPPPLPEIRPEPPTSPGARPVPPPPPPTACEEVADPIEEQEKQLHSPPAPPTRAVPPPPPAQVQTTTQDRTVPPIPMSPTSPQARAPPPPPPGQAPPRRSTTHSSLAAPVRDDSEEEVTEYEGDYDTDIASSAKHKDALNRHNRDSSLEEEEGNLSDDAAPPVRSAPPPVPMELPPPSRQSTDAPRAAPPPLPAVPRQSTDLNRTAPPPLPSVSRQSTDAPRAMPPPIPTSVSAPRESVESPRAPPPLPPAKTSDDDEYDPYRYQAQQPLGQMVAGLRQPTQEFDEEEEDTMPSPERSAPPPPLERAAPPAPPQQAPTFVEPEATSMSGALGAPPKRSVEIGRSNSRRSADVSRPSMEQGFIAADVDLAQSSGWWTKENTPPPALQNRPDVLWETESQQTQKRGGRTSISRDVYVLYQDYSQTTINATFDASEPSHVSFEQSHERPPMPPRKDQLESASEQFGAPIAKTAEKAVGNTIGEGTAQEFVLGLIRPLSSALLPIGTRSYGALVYANLANASTQQHDEIRPGDIVTFRNAKFSGHKGGLHTKYSQELPNHVAVVADWDGTKKKIRVLEQGVSEKGKKSKVREESYRVTDLKSGEVRVWRVMPRSYVNWGSG